MNSLQRLIAVTLSLAALVAAGCSRSEPARSSGGEPAPPASHGGSAAVAPAPAIPPHFPSFEAAQPLPAVLPAEYFRSIPLVELAYRTAARIPGVLAQQPCYCHCDRFGHRSLLDCFATDHGAG